MYGLIEIPFQNMSSAGILRPLKVKKHRISFELRCFSDCVAYPTTVTLIFTVVLTFAL